MKKFAFYASMSIYFFAAAFVLLTVHAQAYIDPSAVSYVIQAVAAVVIAIGAALTIFRHKIAAFFKKGKTQEKKEIHFTEDDAEDAADAADADNAADKKDAE